MEQIAEVFQWIKEILSYTLFNIGDYPLTVGAVILAIIVFMATRYFAIAITQFILKPFFKSRSVDLGRSYAISQVVTYIIYVTGFVAAFSLLGIQISVLWAGAAALLVGVGLGLQQTFNDFFSGLLLLVEGPVEVGNVIEVDGFVGRVIEIGLRTSKIRTRDEIVIIIPNSHLVNGNIINWTILSSPLRFTIDVGVSYASDVDKVASILSRVADDHPDVMKRPIPRVQFVGFGDSSLDFKLLFYSEESWKIEFVKSDLRFKLFRTLKAQGVEIPFPQRDIWIRSQGKGEVDGDSNS